MTSREKLIKLLDDVIYNSLPKHNKGEKVVEDIADYLLSNGVIVLPCKANDDVYIPMCEQIFPFYITSINTDDFGTIIRAKHGLNLGYMFRPKDIGKTVFLTREEAEAKLKECEWNDG